MYTLTVPIKSPRQLPKLVFPERCLKCGKPKAGTRALQFDVSKSDKKSVMLEFEPPLCKECIELENKLEWFSLLPFTISALLSAILGFLLLFFIILPLLPFWDFLGINDRQGRVVLFVLSCAGALVSAVVGGTIIEFALKLLAAPYFGKLIISRPPTIIALSRDLHDVVGLRAQLTSDKKTLTLTFEHEEMAKEFATLNGLAL
jgi:hypothetical protein